MKEAKKVQNKNTRETEQKDLLLLLIDSYTHTYFF